VGIHAFISNPPFRGRHSSIYFHGSQPDVFDGTPRSEL